MAKSSNNYNTNMITKTHMRRSHANHAYHAEIIQTTLYIIKNHYDHINHINRYKIEDQKGRPLYFIVFLIILMIFNDLLRFRYDFSMICMIRVWFPHDVFCIVLWFCQIPLLYQNNDCSSIVDSTKIAISGDWISQFYCYHPCRCRSLGNGCVGNRSIIKTP